MENKIRTTIYLSKEVKRLVDEENINLSKWTDENLLIALCVDSEDDLIAKKSELKDKIKILDERLTKIRATRAETGSKDTLKKEVTGNLREAFMARMAKGLTHDQNLGWITSPKNIIRCKALKETPEVVLKELEAWHDGLQEN